MNLTVRYYQPGDEQVEAPFDLELTREWPWPTGMTAEQQNRAIADPSFNPKHRIYAFDGAAMVGSSHIFRTWNRLDGSTEAFLGFPRLRPGYEAADEMILSQAAAALREEGIDRMCVWAHSAQSGSMEWLERHGYQEHADLPKGQKKYVTYDLSLGRLAIPHPDVGVADEASDGEAIAHAMSIWNACSPRRAKEIYAQWREELEIVGHLVVRKDEEVVASALISRNFLYPSIAAFVYVYATDPDALRQLVSGAIEACIEADAESLLVDLVGAHRHFEPTYMDMGFHLADVHGWYTKRIH